MTKSDRVMAALGGRVPDRLPFSIWFHFGTQHLPGATTAEIHLWFYRAYDLDWIKVMNDYRYPMPPGVVEVSTADELARFRRFGMDALPFARQLEALTVLSRALGGEAPFVDTVFNPYGVARRTLRTHLRRLMAEHPGLVKSFLESVAETLSDYVRAVAATGAAGIFYSVSGLAAGELSDSEFEEWVWPYDEAVLGAIEEQTRKGRFFFSIAHLHGEPLCDRRAFERYARLQAFNWSSWRTAPSLAQARSLTQRALIGGIDEVQLSHRTPSEVAREVRMALEQAGPAGLMIGPGCAVDSQVPADLIESARQACHL